MAIEPQPALLHGPGMLSGLQVWRSATSTRPDDTRALCSRILGLLRTTARQEGAYCLVAVSIRSLDGHPALAQLLAEHPEIVLPREGPGGHAPATQGDVLIQVSAPDEQSRLHLLRPAQRTLEAFCYLDVELLGGRLGDGREAFGFKDGLRAPTHEEIVRDAVISEGPAQGASWILYQRWLQNVERFERLRAPRQADVMGLWPDGAEKNDAPESSHVLLQRWAGGRRPLVRRGFPYRWRGREGLCFLAASRSPDSFVHALDAMLGRDAGGPDALLPYATALEGGVYVAPPDAEWLVERTERLSA